MKLTTPVIIMLCVSALPLMRFDATGVGAWIGGVIGTLGAAHVADKRGRSESLAFWGLAGIWGWPIVACFFKRKPELICRSAIK